METMKGKGCLIALAVMAGSFVSLMYFAMILGTIMGTDASKNTAPDKKHYNKSQEYYNQKNFDASLAYADSAIVHDSTNVDYFIHKAKVYKAINKDSSSYSEISHAIYLLSDDHEKDHVLNQILEWEDSLLNKELTYYILQEKATLYADTVNQRLSNLVSIADKYISLEDTLQTISIYNQILEDNTDQPEINNKLGSIYYNQKKYKKAAYYFEQAFLLDSSEHIYKYNEALATLSAGNKRKAKLLFKIAMEKGNSEACEHFREMTAVTRYYHRTRCCDGTYSSSTGRGTCSHHRGVCGTEAVPYKEYTYRCN